MKLTKAEKRRIENELVRTINQHPNGIETRLLIGNVMSTISQAVPNANRHHVSGMLSWVWRHYNYTFLIRTSGYSVIA